MSLNQPLNFLLPEELASHLGEHARARRLSANLTRKTLAVRSGVPASTIRKFEGTGIISLIGMLQLADALGCMDDFNKLFPAKEAVTIDEFIAPVRKRGRK
jgi:transcriptional regulator with XRE-family HTH domain